MNLILEDYQQLARDWLLTHERAGLWMGMGLGKTASALSAICELFADGAIRGVLVVAPLRVCNITWPSEIAKWDDFKWLKVANLRTSQGWKELKRGRCHIYLINYESLPKLVHEFLQGLDKPAPFDAVVFDESTKAKNPQSRRINGFRPHLGHFTRRWGLTGTPNPNGLMDLFAQVRLLDDGLRLGRSVMTYRSTYMKATDYMERNWVPKSEQSCDTVHEKLSDLVLVLRSSDYLDIADTVQEDIEVALPSEVEGVYKELEKELLVLIGDDEKEVSVPNAAVLINKLLQITGGAIYTEPDKWLELHSAKLDALETLYKSVDGPLLVACHYRHELARILKRFPEARSFADAKSPAQQDAIVAAWNAGKIPMLVSDPRSIGHGLNLQAGGRSIAWFSVNWSRETYDQFNARLARKGQEMIPQVFRILCPRTADDAVVEALETKGAGQAALLAALNNLRLQHR